MHRRQKIAVHKYCRVGIWDTHHGMGRLPHSLATRRAIQTQIVIQPVLWNVSRPPLPPQLRNRLLRGRAERGRRVFSLSRDSVRCSRHGWDTTMIETSQNSRWQRLLCNDTLETVCDVRGIMDGVKSDWLRSLKLDNGISVNFVAILACISSHARPHSMDNISISGATTWIGGPYSLTRYRGLDQVCTAPGRWKRRDVPDPKLRVLSNEE